MKKSRRLLHSHAFFFFFSLAIPKIHDQLGQILDVMLKVSEGLQFLILVKFDLTVPKLSNLLEVCRP